MYNLTVHKILKVQEFPTYVNLALHISKIQKVMQLLVESKIFSMGKGAEGCSSQMLDDLSHHSHFSAHKKHIFPRLLNQNLQERVHEAVFLADSPDDSCKQDRLEITDTERTVARVRGTSC